MCPHLDLEPNNQWIQPWKNVKGKSQSSSCVREIKTLHLFHFGEQIKKDPARKIFGKVMIFCKIVDIRKR